MLYFSISSFFNQFKCHGANSSQLKKSSFQSAENFPRRLFCALFWSKTIIDQYYFNLFPCARTCMHSRVKHLLCAYVQKCLFCILLAINHYQGLSTACSYVAMDQVQAFLLVMRSPHSDPLKLLQHPRVHRLVNVSLRPPVIYTWTVCVWG